MCALPTPESILGNERKPTEERGGDFPAVAKFEKEGQVLVGIYQGETTFPTPDGKVAKGHIWLLKAASPDLKFVLSKKPVTPKEDALVSVSGAVIDRCVKPEDKGKMMEVIFTAGRDSKYNNTTKVFTVRVY